jgi:hypothetical protein
MSVRFKRHAATVSENSVINWRNVENANAGPLDEYLTIEHRLHFHLSGKVELLGGRLRALVPLLENLSEANSVDVHKLLINISQDGEQEGGKRT